MHLDVYSTHMELYPYKKDDFPLIENMFIAEDKFTGESFPCGFMIEDGKLFLPRGCPISKIERLTGCEITYYQNGDDYDEMHRRHYAHAEPRNNIQEESIKFLCELEPQLSLNLSTGVGKTFCVAYATTKLGIKAIIITPNEGLKQQWIGTYKKMFDYRDKDLLNISGSDIMRAIMDDKIAEADVYFVNHQTLRSYMVSESGYALHKFFKKIKVGIKVYDEAHLEFLNTILIDNFSDTNRTWYLTATFDRSSKSESKCFKLAFANVKGYGEIESKQILVKHVVYHVVRINSRISYENKAKVIGYAGFNAISYGKYAFFNDKNETAYNSIKELLKITSHLDGKTLIFVPLIDAVDEVVRKLKNDFPNKTVGAYHSKITSDEKESTLKKDIIVSTIKSCGTGKDIKGLRVVICAEPLASKVNAEQLIGRLRPYAPDKQTYFFDIIDVCIPQMNWWFNARFKKIQELVKEVIYLDLNK